MFALGVNGLAVRSLVDGQWMTRQLDSHAVLARNRQRVESQRHKPRLEAPNVPIWGVSTQTLITAPTINQILPARIKHQEIDDVVVVCDKSLDFREIDGDYNYLNIHPTWVSESMIRAAKVFELSTDQPSVMSNGNGMDDIKMEIEFENSAPLPKLAQSMVVLTFESKKLCFLGFLRDSMGKLKVCCSYKDLFSGHSYPEQIGAHLAIDPSSFALAVAAQENLFTFISLKSRQTIIGQIQNNQNIDPVGEEVTIPVDGVILKMEFLYPPSSDSGHVVLLLLVHKDEKTRLFCYEWDSSSTSVRTIRQVASGQILRSEEECPLLVIPLRFGSAFMLVGERDFSVYRDILTGSATFCRQPLYDLDVPEENGLSRLFPRYIQWARPSRTLDHASREDNVYLCREDGVIRFLEIKDRSPDQMVDTQSQVGRLKVNVDTAFTCLQLGSGQDHIITGGDMGDGGIWELRARENAERKSNMANWTPMHNLLVVRDATQGVPQSGSFGTNRIFSCTGRGNIHGAITEIRHGVRGICRSSTTLPATNSLPSSMWVLNDDRGDGDCKLVFISHVTHTVHFTINYGVSQLPEIHGIDLETPTLAMGLLDHGVVAQVTRQSINLVHVYSGESSSIQIEDGLHYVTANFLDARGRKSLITVSQKANNSTVELWNAGQGPIGTPVLKALVTPMVVENDQITSVAIDCLGSELFVVVGACNSMVRVYSVDEGLHYITETATIDDFSRRGVSSCDSIALIERPGDDALSRWIVCGLRNGLVALLRLFDDNGLYVQLDGLLTLGTTSVQVSKGGHSDAVMQCENTLFHASFSQDVGKLILDYPLLLSKQGNATLAPDGIHAVAKIPFTSETRLRSDDASTWLCVEREELIEFDVFPEEAPLMVPQQLPVEGSPKHLIFSERLQAFVVITTTTKVDETQRPPLRCLQHYIQLFTLGGKALKEQCLIPLQPGEMVLGLMEWFPRIGSPSDEHHLLVLNTSISYGSQHRRTGRILISHIESQKQPMFKKAKSFDCPIDCIAVYTSYSIVYCSGTEIGELKLRSEMHGQKPSARTSKVSRLSSRARQMSVDPVSSDPRYIYVSTEQNSLQIFTDTGTSFSLLFSDPQHRAGLCHLALPDVRLVLTTSHNALHGLWIPPEPRIDGTAPLVFSAQLPGSIRDLRLLSNQDSGNKLVPSKDDYHKLIGTGLDGAVYRIDVLPQGLYDKLANEQEKLGQNVQSGRPLKGRSLRHIDLDLCRRERKISDELKQMTKRLTCEDVLSVKGK